MDWGKVAQGALETGANALTGGLASGIGSFFSGLFGGDSEKANRKFQEQMLDKQLNFQSEQAQLNRGFQAGEADKMRDYNSIASQMQRAQAAGVNPWSLVSSGGQVGTAQTSVPAGSMPSGSASIPSAVPANQLVRAQSFNAVADAINAVANARKAGLESDRYNQLIDMQINKMMAEIRNTDFRTEGQSILNEINDGRKRAIVAKAFVDLDNASLAGIKTMAEVDELRGRLQKHLADAGLSKAQTEQIWKFIDKYMDRMYESEIGRNKSQTTANYAQADRDSSQAQLNEAIETSYKLDNWIRDSTAVPEMRSKIHSYDIIIKSSQAQIDAYKAQARKLIAEGKYAEAQQVVGMMNQTINSVSNLISSVRPGVTKRSK